jgi:hypothetical protein
MAIPRNLANFAPKLDSSGNPTFTAPTVFSAGTASDPSITFTGDTNTGLFAPAADTIAFTEGGTERMRIDSEGAIIQSHNGTNCVWIRGNTVSVASGATVNITTTSAGGALVVVYDSGNGPGGVFFFDYTNAVVKIAGSGEATDTGSSFAVFKSSSSHTCTFKNKHPSTLPYAIAVYSANAIR